VRTEELIERLAAEARPIRRLPPPSRRLALWLAITLPSVAAVVLTMGPRPDLWPIVMERRFQIEQAAAFATALAAAFAAFSAVIPGRSWWPFALPVLPLAVWVGSLSLDCIGLLIDAGPAALRIEWDWVCLPAIATVGAVPAIAIVVMLRRGAPVMPCTAVAFGALAAGALGNFGLRLFHAQDASLMVLVWQFGSVVLLTVMAGCVGRHLLPWRHTNALR
jgi:hypothetical protein